MSTRIGANETASKAPRLSSRDAIIDAAERLCLERGFGAVNMDDLAEAAGVARRTVYNQFPGKEDIVREMLGRLSDQLEHALPPGLETSGGVEDVLPRIGRAILNLHKQPKYLGFLRMVAADSRHHPWIGEAFAAAMDPQRLRMERYVTQLTALGILDCRNPTLAAQQFAGMLNEVSLWPWMTGCESRPAPDEEVVEETVRMFLHYYRRSRSPARR